MRLLVCGSRDWTDGGEVAFHLALIFGASRERVVIHGNCGVRARPPRGADVLAGWCAGGVGASVEVFAVDHAKDGPWPDAGPRRNQRMLDEGRPDRGLAFGPLWRWIQPTPAILADTHKLTGTGDMTMRLLRARLPVRWIADPDADAVDLTEMPRPA